MTAVAWIMVRLRLAIVAAWLVAAVAALVYLPDLRQSGDKQDLLGLVPDNAEALAAAARSTQLFDVPILAETAVVQRDPDGLRGRRSSASRPPSASPTGRIPSSARSMARCRS